MGGEQSETISYWDPEDVLSKYYQSEGSHFYQFETATAMSFDKVSANDRIAPDSLCASGWQLPSGNSSDNKSWTNLLRDNYGYELNNSYDAKSIRRLPISITLSGFINSSKIHAFIGEVVHYWSSKRYDTENAYRLYAKANEIAFFNSSTAFTFGLSIRCVKK